ncbi:MAG: sigma-54-dependent Fis family transcriptional regulator [Myxococcales bacterium]|nr:sigma-54-dependent Fis family transcriptional regulator [Myxococcales bacterium]
MSGSILIVDNDVDGVAMLRGALRSRGYEVEAVDSGAAALDWLALRPVDLVLAHLRMPGMSGVELCSALRDAHPDLLTIVVSGDGTLGGAIGAIRAGAYDYIAKPIDLEALGIALERAIAHVSLRRELLRLRGEVAAARPIASIVGNSPALRKVVELVHKVADSDATVLIVGETGTGKELFARAIHDGSPRRELPFAAINCAAVPAALLESELFGHVKGSFTDARRSRPGLFVEAGGGTVFLDEIGEMPLEMQVKLLRVLQERRVRPIGGEGEVPFEARVIAATNRDLEADVAEKRFREDLYYRVNVVQIPLPPLRARPGDLLMLAHHFIQKIATRTGKAVVGVSPEAAQVLVDYDWPGNVRELENCLERAIALTCSNQIAVDDLPEKVRRHQRAILATATGMPSELISLAEVERRYVRQVLNAAGGNKSVAARILGIDRRSLYRRLEDTPSGAEHAIAST